MTHEENLAETISNGVNAMGLNLSAFTDAMGRQHRTLQQSFTRLCFAWIRHLAQLGENQYDLRNEASVKTCREIVEKTEGKLFLPYI